MLEVHGTPSNEAGGDQKRQCAESEEGYLGDITGESDAVINLATKEIALRLHAQVIVPRRHARHSDSVLLLAFGPETVFVVAMVVADFAAEVDGLTGVFIDLRVVKVNPLVVHVCVGNEFKV